MDRKGKHKDPRISKEFSAASSSQKLIDINEATVEQLEMLSGIGRAKAEAIVDDRMRSGLFTSVSDLTRVGGIGKSVLDLNRAVLICLCPTMEVSSNSKTKRRETRSVAAKRERLLSRTIQLRALHPSTKDTVSNRTRSGSNNVGSTVSSDKPLNCLLVSTSATKSILELPSTSSGQLSMSDDTKTPNDVRASLEPLFEGCRRHTPVRLALSKTGDVLETVGDVAIPGPSEDSRTSRSRCMALRSNCNGTVTTGATDVLGNNDRNRAYEDLDGDYTSSGHSGSDSCLEPLQSLSQTKPLFCNAAEKNMIKRKAEDCECSVEFKKSFSSNGNCITNGYEICDRMHSCHTESTASAPKKQRIPSRKNPPAMLTSWIHTFQEWSHAERLVALDALVESCSPTQVRHIMQVIEPQFQRDFISFLPKELALYVLSFLEPRDLVRASQTCRYWRTLAEDNLLWREKCQEEGLSEAVVFGLRVNRRRQDRRCGNVIDKNGVTQWKSIYKRQRQIENNWSHGILRAPKLLKGHDDHVITCLEFNGSKIVSGSDDNTLKVWSAVTGKCLRTLVGHTGGVWSSQMSGHMVISGSTDRTLKVWNIDTGQCIYTLYGHTSTVRCMHLHGNRLVSGSRDATLRIWDIDSGHCLRVLIGHVAAVRCVQFDGRRVVSGAYDYMVKIWDPDTETCLQTLAGHTNRVYSLQFDGAHIVSGSLDTSIRVWNAETGSCLHTLIGHQSLTSGMELRDNILVSGNADSTVKVWNITNGQCLQTLQGANKHQSAVTCLQFNRRFVITSSDDGTVKIWDLRTGEFLRNLVALDSGGSGGVVWRIRCSNTSLVCAVGSRNGTEETKLLILDFDLNNEDDSESNTAVVSD